MMKKIKTIILSAFFSISAFAQVADIELTYELNGVQGGFNNTQWNLFTVYITNHGPDPIGQDSPYYYPHFLELTKQKLNSDLRTDIEVFLHPAIDVYCYVDQRIEDSPNSGDQYLVYELRFPKLLAGESVGCAAVYAANYSQGFRSLTWSTEPDLTNSDPNPSNNTAEFSHWIASETIPLFNIWGILTLILLIIIITQTNRKINHSKSIRS